MKKPEAQEILDLIDKASLRSRKSEAPRSYIGASIVGNHCDALLGFSVRGYPDNPPNSPHVLRIFELGHTVENIVVRDLKKAGLPIIEANPMTGKQWTYRLYGGLVIGHADGLMDFEGEPHIVEIKTMNAASFSKFDTIGIKYSHRSYYDQVQFLMGLSGYKKTMFIAYCKDTSKYHVEYVDFDPFAFSVLVMRVQRVLGGHAEKISNDTTDWRCMDCFKREACVNGALPEKSIRTCGNSLPNEEGKFVCQNGCVGQCQNWVPWVPLERSV